MSTSQVDASVPEDQIRIYTPSNGLDGVTIEAETSISIDMTNTVTEGSNNIRQW